MGVSELLSGMHDLSSSSARTSPLYQPTEDSSLNIRPAAVAGGRVLLSIPASRTDEEIRIGDGSMDSSLGALMKLSSHLKSSY